MIYGKAALCTKTMLCNLKGVGKMFMLMVCDHVFTCFGKVVMSQCKCFLSCID